VGGALAIGLALYQFWGDWLHDPADRRDLRHRPVCRRQHHHAAPGGQVGGPASGLASVRPVGLRLVFRLHRHAGGSAGDGGMGVLVRFGVEQYRHSLLYWGSSGRTAALPEGGAEAATGGASARAADEPAP
jgi:hypothetical protein